MAFGYYFVKLHLPPVATIQFRVKERCKYYTVFWDYSQDSMKNKLYVNLQKNTAKFKKLSCENINNRL